MLACAVHHRLTVPLQRRKGSVLQASLVPLSTTGMTFGPRCMTVCSFQSRVVALVASGRGSRFLCPTPLPRLPLGEGGPPGPEGGRPRLLSTTGMTFGPRCTTVCSFRSRVVALVASGRGSRFFPLRKRLCTLTAFSRRISYYVRWLPSLVFSEGTVPR